MLHEDSIAREDQIAQPQSRGNLYVSGRVLIDKDKSFALRDFCLSRGRGGRSRCYIKRLAVGVHTDL